MSIFGFTSPLSRGGVFVPYYNTDAVVSRVRASIRIGVSVRSATTIQAHLAFRARVSSSARNFEVAVSLPKLSATIMGASQARASLPAFSSAITSSETIVHSVSVTLPPFRLVPRQRARASLRIGAHVQSSASVTLTGITWATNLKTGETTKFLAFPFRHVIRLGSDSFGVKADGLYRIGGDSDSGANIDCDVTTHKSQFDSEVEKRVTHVWADAGNSVTIQTIVDGVAKTALPTDILRGRTARVPLARGDRGRYWSFKVRNVAGGAIKLSELEVLMFKLKTRV